MQALQSSDFDSKVLQSKALVVVDFWAEWCGPCKMLTPVLEKVAEAHQGVKFYKMNTDQCSDVAGQFRIMSIPCLVMMQGGKEIDRLVGFHTQEKLDNWVAHHEKSDAAMG